jgi:type I restriction enzyme S subunit
MNPYPKYKPSGIEWIGDIPEHWELLRIKGLLESETNGAWGSEEMGTESDVYCIRVADFDKEFDQPSRVANTLRNISSDDLAKRKLEAGDLMIEKSGGGEVTSVGRVGFYDWDDRVAITSNFMARLRLLPQTDSRFAYYYFKKLYANNVNLKSIKQTTGIQNLDTANYFNELTPLPPLPEQTAIANYLDEKTGQIDDLVAKKQRLIELMKEERTALISEVVTGKAYKSGLISPPTNGKPLKYKPSGIEWIGEIPEWWEVKRLKYVAHIRYGLGQPPREKPDGLPLLRATNIERGRINETDLVFVDPDDVPYERDPILKENDIVVVRSGAYTADSALIPKEFAGAISGYDMVVRANKDNSPKFLSYCLLSHYVLTHQLSLNVIRAAQPHLNREELGEALLLLPGQVEQLALASLLEKMVVETETTIAIVQKEISLLQEYRTALISEVVTGKVKVVS